MGFLDSILGRSRPKPPDLDALFQVPAAALTLSTTLGLDPTGSGSVCYRGAAGPAFAQLQRDVSALLSSGDDAPSVSTVTDGFGFTWTVLEHAGPAGDGPAGDGSGGDARDATGTSAGERVLGVADLCTALHAVNTSLEMQGFGTGLLCTVVPFAGPGGQRVALVYLYKQGTFYPFAPMPGAHAGDPRRDNLLELQVRDTLAGELPVEKDLQRWMALWDAPGL